MSSASFDSIPNHSLLCVTDGGDVVVFHIDTTIRKSPVVSSALYRCDESAWCGTLRNNRIFVSANSKQIHIWPAEPVEGEAGQNLLGSEKHSWKLSGHVHNIPSFGLQPLISRANWNAYSFVYQTSIRRELAWFLLRSIILSRSGIWKAMIASDLPIP
eukprot:TRINITY_DN235_c0_g1_i1.p2 TRINITY_DN235_c0_g1~~TRINITY_DN235_c0_g1_i1.p2  ORF type:complete len:158 (-),score=16.78 TRINITY_DN235_c0_g1_i1:855-1328(-)